MDNLNQLKNNYQAKRSEYLPVILNRWLAYCALAFILLPFFPIAGLTGNHLLDLLIIIFAFYVHFINRKHKLSFLSSNLIYLAGVMEFASMGFRLPMNLVLVMGLLVLIFNFKLKTL